VRVDYDYGDIRVYIDHQLAVSGHDEELRWGDIAFGVESANDGGWDNIVVEDLTQVPLSQTRTGREWSIFPRGPDAPQPSISL
jgi:hypothetical protein